MCIATNRPPVLAGTIGDLVPGTQYHDPNGETWMVLDPCTAAGIDLPRAAGDTVVVNLRTGQITPVYSNVKLGLDHKERLYASTYLNEWYCDAPVAPAGDTAQEEQWRKDIETLEG